MLRECENSVDAGRVAERDKSKPSRPPGGWVLHHHHLGNVTELREILANVLRSRLPGKSANEHLAWVVGDLVEIDGSEGGEHAWQ